MPIAVRGSLSPVRQDCVQAMTICFALLSTLTRDQTANIRWTIEKAREFQKNIYFCFIDYAKVFDCVDHNKLWKILQEMEYQTTWPASWEIFM